MNLFAAAKKCKNNPPLREYPGQSELPEVRMGGCAQPLECGIICAVNEIIKEQREKHD